MNDLEIIELYFERDEKAIKETDAKYGKLCHSIANNILNNEQDSEECVNDTYIGVWNAFHRASLADFRLSRCFAYLLSGLRIYHGYRTHHAQKCSVGRGCDRRRYRIFTHLHTRRRSI